MSDNESLATYERWLGGFPAVHARHTLDDIIVTDENNMASFMQAADKLVDEWKGQEFAGLYLWGDRPGTGKSMAAIALARALHDKIEDSTVSYTHMPTASYNAEFETGYSDMSSGDFWQPRGIKFRADKTVGSNSTGSLGTGTAIVHVLDEFRQQHILALYQAAEVAALKGNLLLVTSDLVDPLGVIEAAGNSGPKSAQDAIAMEHLERTSPEMYEQLVKEKKSRDELVATTLRRCFESGILPIQFVGPDMRPDKSFWNS